MKKTTLLLLAMIPILLHLPLVQAKPIATPLTEAGYFALTLVNKTKVSNDNNTYLLIKANTDTQDCFMQFDHDGYGTCKPVSNSTKPSNYSYALSALPSTIYLPKSISGRIYFSLGYPMDFFVDPNTQKIVDPDGFKPRDANYFTLYDKVEYSYTDNGTWMNPTAVDFFSMPIRIDQPDSTSGVTAAGFSKSRENIFKSAQEFFTRHDKTDHKIWNHLFLNYLNDSGEKTILRLVAPGKAMVANIPNTQPFDQDYLNNKNAYGFSYTNFLWDYYKTHTVTIDCSELKNIRPDIDNFIFTGKIVDDQFVFTNQTGTNSVAIDMPQHSTPFFAGAGETFDAPNNTPKAIIIRQLTSAFEVGLLPAPDGTTIDKNYFLASKEHYYNDDPLLPQEASKQGPWYDLYSKALHSFGDTQPIYTFAYDDALGQDGTLYSSNAKTPSATITLEDMSGTKIPDPYTDNTRYNITLIIGKGSNVTYNGQTLKTNESLNNVPIPFHAVFNGKDAYIYIKHPLVRPYFDGADGIVINKETGNSAQIIFPGK